jgi:hypothetical protein
LVAEYSPAGLLALNRGTAGGHTFVLSPAGELVGAADGPQAARLAPHVAAWQDFVAGMEARYGPVALEGVYADGRIYFVDYSVLGHDPVVVSPSGAVRISPGTARGRLLRLDEDELLSRLSIGPAVSIDKSADVTQHAELAAIIDRIAALDEKPVIQVSRPYAVLSVLIGHVAGFVFEQGSTLSHLAILLREAHVPAVAAPGLPSTGDVLISDGTVSLTVDRRE